MTLRRNAIDITLFDHYSLASIMRLNDMKQNTHSPTKWILLITLVISIIMLAFTAHAFNKAARGDHCDFQAYYVAAKAL